MGFNRSNGMLIIKGKGSLGDYAEGSKCCEMEDHYFHSDVPWFDKYKDQIKPAMEYIQSAESIFCCEILQSVLLPNAIKSIGEDAFEGCSGLKSVVIPSSVASIGDWAFASCSSLSSIAVPKSVPSIRGYAFDECSNLKTVSIPKGLECPLSAFPRRAKISEY